MCYTDLSVWTVCAHAIETPHKCKRRPLVSRFSACFGWPACRPSQKWSYRVRLGFCPNCVDVFEPQFDTKDVGAIRNYWTWKAKGDSYDATRMSEGSENGVLRAHPYDIPLFDVWWNGPGPEPDEDELEKQYRLMVEQLNMFWIPEGPNRLAAAIQARKATVDYFSGLKKGIGRTGPRGCYPPPDLVPPRDPQPDGEPGTPKWRLVRQDSDDTIRRGTPIDLTVLRPGCPSFNSSVSERVDVPSAPRRRGNNLFPPRRDSAFVAQEQDDVFEDIELDDGSEADESADDFDLLDNFLLSGLDLRRPRRPRWATAAEILSSPDPRAQPDEDEQFHEYWGEHDDDNASSVESSNGVSESLVTSLVSDPYVEARDAVAVWYTSPNMSPILVRSSRSGSPNLDVDPASVPLPEDSMEEIHYFLGLPWPPVNLLDEW